MVGEGCVVGGGCVVEGGCVVGEGVGGCGVGGETEHFWYHKQNH